jgi:hypothetical protein
VREPLGAEHDGGNDEQHDELAAVDAEHESTLTVGAANRTGTVRSVPRPRTVSRTVKAG